MDQEFKTVRYELELSVDGDALSYRENTQLRIRSQEDLFHDTDENTLRRVT